MDQQNEELRPERLRYSAQNPPTSIEAAEQRVQALEYEIPHMEVQLKHKNEMDFESFEDFTSWKNRAMSALTYAIKEQRFLMDFVRRHKAGTRPDENRVEFPVDVIEFTIAVRSIGQAFSKELVAILADFEKNRIAMNRSEQRTRITELKLRVEAMVTQVSQHCNRLGSHAKRKSIVEPVASVARDIDAAMRKLRR